MSQDKAEVVEEATSNIDAMKCNPREFIRDPVMLEFLGLPSAGKVRESGLEQALISRARLDQLRSAHSFMYHRRAFSFSTRSRRR